MITRLVFITDTHFRAQTPINRTDNFLESLLKKFEWVLKFAREKKAHIIHGGDFWDSPRVSDEVACRVADLINEYRVFIAIILGQHDVIGKNLETEDRTKTRLFRHFKYFEHLVKDDDYIIHNPHVKVHGIDFDVDNPVPDKIIINRVEGKINIAVVHGLIAERNLIVNGKQKLICWENVKTNADLVLSGDYHPGYGIQHDDLMGTFVNPGSFARMDAGDGKSGRKPMLAYIVIKNGSIRNLKLVKIPCESNPFDLKAIAAKVTVQEQKDRFIKALEELSDTSVAGDNIIEMLDNVNASKTIVRRCKEKIMELRDAK